MRIVCLFFSVFAVALAFLFAREFLHWANHEVIDALRQGLGQ